MQIPVPAEMRSFDLPSESDFVKKLVRDAWSGAPALLWANFWFVLVYLPPLELWMAALGPWFVPVAAGSLLPLAITPLTTTAVRIAVDQPLRLDTPLRSLFWHLGCRLALAAAAFLSGCGVLFSLLLAASSWIWVPVLAVQTAVGIGLTMATFSLLCLNDLFPSLPLCDRVQLAIALIAVRPVASLSLVAVVMLSTVLGTVIGPATWWYLPAMTVLYATEIVLLNLRRLEGGMPHGHYT